MPNPSSVFGLLAQGVTDALNAETFSPAAEARRGWRILLQTGDTEAPILTVVPTAKTIENAARGIKKNTVTLSVIAQRQHGGTSGEDDPVGREDEIASLAQQVEDFLLNPANQIIVSDGEGADLEEFIATPTGLANSEVVQEWLAENVFAVLLTIEFTLFRS